MDCKKCDEKDKRIKELEGLLGRMGRYLDEKELAALAKPDQVQITGMHVVRPNAEKTGQVLEFPK